jgi:hypothetical protein
MLQLFLPKFKVAGGMDQNKQGLGPNSPLPLATNHGTLMDMIIQAVRSPGVKKFWFTSAD